VVSGASVRPQGDRVLAAVPAEAANATINQLSSLGVCMTVLAGGHRPLGLKEVPGHLMGFPSPVVERWHLALELVIRGNQERPHHPPKGRVGTAARFWVWTVSVQTAHTRMEGRNWSPMPSKQVVSDEALARALGMYAGMVGRVLNNPRRWLGVDEDPPLTARFPVRVLDAVRDRALGDVTPASPHWAEQPESKRVDWWLRRIAVGAALAAAAPRFVGALADRMPLQAALGASQPSSPFAPLRGNVAPAPPPTGFRFSHK
jgi:hypothetical protein